MRKTQDLSEVLNPEENNSIKRKCGKGLIKCMGIIIFCVGISGISFYAGVRYSNYLNDNSESF